MRVGLASIGAALALACASRPEAPAPTPAPAPTQPPAFVSEPPEVARWEGLAGELATRLNAAGKPCGAVATVMRSFVQAHGTELSASSQALAAWEEGAPRRAVEAFHRRVFPAIEVRIDAGIRCRDDRAAVEAFDRFFQAAGLDLR